MEQHTTNYQNTFIEVADDCPVAKGEIPPLKGDQKTVANLQFEMISKNPYKFTSDDVLFHVFAERNDLTLTEHKVARLEFFSKGQACLRASPLTKRYGWGVQSDKDGKVAICGVETPAYKQALADPSLTRVKAMKTKR